MKAHDSTVPTVWIVVLHWQGIDHTRTCLTSLRGLDYPSVKIVLVDNGSTEKTGRLLSLQFPEISLLELSDNLGFAGGCNAGINHCLESGAEWVWLLNNDTRVAIDSLSYLMRSALTNPQAGCLGAVVQTGSGDRFVDSGPGEIDFQRAKTYLRQNIPAGETVPCTWIGGSNLLLRAESIRQHGIFDPDYFLYFEDTDLCFRLTRAGWQCLLVPQARIEHVGGGSTEGSRRYWRAYYYTRNRLLFFCRYLHGAALVPALLSIAGHLLRHALVLPFRGDAGRKQLYAELLGLSDYLNHRLGKASCLDWCE